MRFITDQYCNILYELKDNYWIEESVIREHRKINPRTFFPVEDFCSARMLTEEELFMILL